MPNYNKKIFEKHKYYLINGEMFRKLAKNKLNPKVYNLFIDSKLNSYNVEKLIECYDDNLC